MRAVPAIILGILSRANPAPPLTGRRLFASPFLVRMQKKLFIKTFGCQMNEYDSDKMADVLNVSEGVVKTNTPEDADIILFNTCSVREKAQEKVFSDLGRARELKLKNPKLVIGVGGCVASQEGAAIIRRAPYLARRRYIACPIY